MPFREEELWNGYPEETNAPYGVAKKSVLVGAQAYREQYGLDAIFLLPANLYGPGDNFDLQTSHVIPALIRKMEESEGEVVLWGDGSPTREFLYVDDCAEGLALAAERYDAAEPVNLGTGVETSIREVAETVAELTGFRGEIRLGHVDAERAAPSLARRDEGGARSSASGRGRAFGRVWSGRSRGTARTPSPVTAASVRTAAATAAPFVAILWLTAAITAAAAEGYDQAAWWLLLMNQLVLAPAAVVAALCLGSAVGGRAIGLLSALLLVTLPAVGVLYALAGYRDTYVDRVLPEAVGIAAGGRFPAAALSLVAGALAIRGLTTDGRRIALLAGLVAGTAALAHPSGVLVLVGIGLAYAIAWRPREGAVLALGAAPGVVLAAVAYGIELDVSWDAFTGNMTGLREYLWSNRLLQWLPLAGAIGAARGSLPVGCLLAGWFGAFAFVFGASPQLGAEDGSYLVAFVPALPAYSLLVACIPMLVPTLPRRLERLALRLP